METSVSQAVVAGGKGCRVLADLRHRASGPGTLTITQHWDGVACSFSCSSDCWCLSLYSLASPKECAYAMVAERKDYS